MSTVKNHRLLAIGAVHIDDTATPVGPLVAKASNPVRWARSIGGVTANALRAARRESPLLDIDFIAAVGDDAFAGMLTEVLQKQSINTQFVTLDNTRTGRYSVILDQAGELFIGLADVDNAERVTLEHIVHKASAQSPDAVLIDTNLHTSTIAAIAHHVNAQWRCPLIGLAVSPAKVIKLLPVREQFSLLICNRREAIALLQAGNAPSGNPTRTATASLADINHVGTDTLARALIELGFSRLVLTDGADPVIIVEEDHMQQVTVPTLAIDSTVNGAGDAMAGAIVAHWLTGSSLIESVRTAGLPAASRILSGEIPPQRL